MQIAKRYTQMPLTATAKEKQRVAIVDDNSTNARQLANATGLTLINSDSQSCTKTTQWSYTLQWIDEKLTLRHHVAKRAVDINIDFTAGRAQHRLKFGGGHGQPLARAVKSRDQPLIGDATAGFGKDAFVFASLGCEVVLLERSAVVHALLRDALTRAKNKTETKKIAERMHLYHAESNLLPGNWPHPQIPQIIYLDPMYPDNKRAAKKEIQTLRELLDKNYGQDTKLDDAKLLSAARATAARVVVKRPRKAEPLADVSPIGNITSPNTRYDIYSANR